MKSNKSKSRFGSASVIYLITLLVVVLFYLGLAYPKLSAKISELHTQIQNIRMEINLLKPYSNQIAALNEKSDKEEKEYEANDELDEPILFSNILYECADKANITVSSIGITSNQPVEIAGVFESENSSASVTLTAENNMQIENFISMLENNKGSAMSVQNLSYAINDGAVSASATIIMYTVKK